jgi:hypothetical protein
VEVHETLKMGVIRGRLLMTNYKLAIIPEIDESDEIGSLPKFIRRYLQIPYGVILRIERSA